MGLIIPVFIAHRGCPHQCLFCNQNTIAGQDGAAYDGDNVAGVIDTWLARSPGRQSAEVAFYGGSFTCLPQAEQLRLLSAVQPYLAAGLVGSIRLSTRPDCVSGENSRWLGDMGVTTVELGVQSLDDRVLESSLRGHSADASRCAMRVLRNSGLRVGVQLLPGLPGETTRSFLGGVREIAAFRPELVRIYPALVVTNSPLAELYRQGGYTPLTLHRAIGLVRRAREMLEASAIPVVRMGLQPSASLARDVVAGPYHPAFGELVTARQWFRQLRQHLSRCLPAEHLRVHIASRDHSAVVGMKRANIIRLEKLGFSGRFSIIPEKDRERGSVKYVVS